MEVHKRYPVRRLSLKDDFDFDINDISRASTPTSTMSSKSEGRRRERSHHRSHSIEDYRRKISKLKNELEAERARTKQVYREKSVEVKAIRDSYNKEKQREIESIEAKLAEEKKKEIELLQESIIKKKDKELQQVLRYKEDEIDKLRERFEQEKDKAMQTAVKSEKKQFEENAAKMEKEIKKLKSEKDKVEKEYQKKCEEEMKKEKEFSQVKEGYDAELRKILSESKKLAMGNLQKLKKAEKALSEGVISEDEALSITESLCITPFSEISSRTPSRPLATRMDEFKMEDVEIDKYLASATPSPHPSTTPLGKTYTVDGKSPHSHILQPQESTSNSASYSEQSGLSKERSQWTRSAPKVKPRIIKNRKVTEEKDRQLQRRIAELQAQTQRLERKIALVKTENETLKRQKDDQKPLEEKIKTLKKRNAELAAIARRLEEKAKHLQQENVKKAREEVSQPESDHLKKMFARQRAKDLAEHAKAMLAKDREIEDLRRKCQELADQLSNADFLGPENIQMYEEKEELVTIIKQAAKERLQLEKQLAKTKPTPTAQAEAKKVKELESTNETLQKELEKLEKAKEDTEKLEIELTQKKIECETLSEEIKREKFRSKELENDLQESASYNTQLTVQVSDLQHRLQDLEKVNEECNVLRLNLTAAQHECNVAKDERNVLQTKVDSLEFTVKNLKESAEKLQNLEYEHENTIQQLQEKQSQIESLQQAQDIAKEEYEEVLQSLQTRITELQQNCQHQEERHKLLTEQLQTLQAAASRNNFKHSSSHNPPLPKISANQNHSSSNQRPVEESFHQSNASLHESAKLVNSNDSNQVDSTKSLDTGFADDDETELDHSNDPSPDQGKSHGDQFEDPELYEIAKKLKELEASDSEEDHFPSEDKGEDSGMESQKEQKVKNGNNDENGLSVLARKGPISVFIAKYSYDPFQHSPNENPDAELPLNSGDYVLIYGDMDEDGFFDGELITGRKGLVPSNFIEKVADEDLSLFHAAMAGVNHHDDDSTAGNSIQQDLDFDSSEETDEKAAITLEMKQVLSQNDSYGSKSPESPIERPSNPTLDVSQGDSRGDISHTPSGGQASDLDELDISEGPKLINTDKSKPSSSLSVIPCPQQLTLDRQLTNSILISWKPPEVVENLEIKSYHVYVDNNFKALVRVNERTKALVENVDIREVHRVSVRCNSNQGQSLESQCTMLVGKDCVPAPTELKVCDITPNSAHISWLPGNSNYQHSIFVNGQAVRVVKPGVNSHTLTGLVPGSEHKVTITAKNLRGGTDGENLFASLQFRTKEGGLPEPPLNVQVEAGPQEGTLLLTWLPVTIDTTGFSNGAVVTGYMVYADGRRTREAIGPTNDHIILSSDDFKGFIPKQLMVRTMTGDNKESANSDIVKLPQSLIKEITEGAAKSVVPATKVIQKSPIHQVDANGDTDEDLDATFQQIAEKAERDLSPMIDNIEYEDDFVETSSSSELSDIPEEVEEESEDPNQNSRPGKLSPILVNGQVSGTKGVTRVLPKSSSVPNRKIQTTNVESRNDMSSRPRPSPRIVPAIEITRDSSTEVDNSFDVSDEELEYRVHKTNKSSPKANQSNDIDNKHQKNTNFTDAGTENNKTHHDVSSASVPLYSGMSIKEELNNMTAFQQINKCQDDNFVPKNVDRLESPVGSDTNQKHDGDMTKVSPQSTKKRLGSPNKSDTDNMQMASDSPKRREGVKSPHQKAPPSPRRRVVHHKAHSRSPSNSPHKDTETHLNDSNANKVVNSVTSSKSDEGTHIPQLDLTDYDESGEVDSISGEINPPVEDNRIRLFVALFDYDPESMSPNVDSLEEELPFKEGQIIKIFGDKDPDGFYRGECNGRVGFVPCNMVSEIQVEDPDLADQLLKESQVAFNTHITENDNYIKPVELDYKGLRSSPNKITTTTITNSNHMRKMVSLYDYDPQELSPNVDAELELPFKSGEILTIYGEMDDDGFYMGELNGQRGLVPSNFLQDIPPSDEDAVENSSIVSPARSGESLNNLSGSRLSDLSVDKTQKLGSNTQVDQLGSDRVSNPVQSVPANRSRSVSPEDTKQKKKSTSILTKGKNILKKLTR